MMCYSVQPRNKIFVKGYSFLSFAKNMGKTICKDIGKKLSGKYSQKFLDYNKQSTTDPLKTVAKRAIEKTAEEIGYLIGKKITKLHKPQKLYSKMKQLQVYRIQAYNSIMCRYFCIKFIDFMLKIKVC